MNNTKPFSTNWPFHSILCCFYNAFLRGAGGGQGGGDSSDPRGLAYFLLYSSLISPPDVSLTGLLHCISPCTFKDLSAFYKPTLCSETKAKGVCFVMRLATFSL